MSKSISLRGKQGEIDNIGDCSSEDHPEGAGHISKEIREKLKANAVYFEVEGDIVMVKPVRDAAGSLREFAGNARPGASLRQAKDKAWEAAVREKTGKKSS